MSGQPARLSQYSSEQAGSLFYNRSMENSSETNQTKLL